MVVVLSCWLWQAFTTLRMLVQSLDKVIGSEQSQWAAVLDKFRQIETAVDNRYGKFYRVIAVQKSLKGLEIDLTADHTRELIHCIVSSRRSLLSSPLLTRFGRLLDSTLHRFPGCSKEIIQHVVLLVFTDLVLLTTRVASPLEALQAASEATTRDMFQRVAVSWLQNC